MANRAYLVTLDRPETNRPSWINDEERRYFDSRWTIPLAWLFFFRPKNMVVVDEDDWGPALRLVANPPEACAYFVQKRPLLEQLVSDPSSQAILDFLYTHVVQWPQAANLVLDPDEIWECGPEDIPLYRPILEAIANPHATPDSVRHAIRATPDASIVTDFSDTERFEVHLIGYTYW